MSFFKKVKRFLRKKTKIALRLLKPTLRAIENELKDIAADEINKIVGEAMNCIEEGGGFKCAVDVTLSSLEVLAKKHAIELSQKAAKSLAATLVEEAKEALEEQEI